MPTSSFFNSIFSWAFPFIYFLAHGLVLVACIFGMLRPSLRREFIWLGISALLRCLASFIQLVPPVMRQLNPLSGTPELTYQIMMGANVIALLSLPFLCVGFMLLAARAKYLPAINN